MTDIGGGASAEMRNERICRFEFPERPGALMQFLEALSECWSCGCEKQSEGARMGPKASAVHSIFLSK